MAAYGPLTKTVGLGGYGLRLIICGSSFGRLERQHLAAPRTPPLETIGTEVYLTVEGPFIVACGTLDGWVNGFHDIAYSFNELL